nr:outer membrane beta-barrel protein [uncultured Flavobacterium sp.]
MKKIIPAALFLLLTGVCFAQEKHNEYGFSKGDTFLSLKGSYYNSKGDNYKTTAYSISPLINYFPTDHIALGMGLSYGKQKAISYGPEAIIANTHQYAIYMAGRYYFNPKSRLPIYMNVSTEFTNSRQQTKLLEDVIHQNYIYNQLGAGANYFLSSHFVLQIELPLLSHTHYIIKSTNTRNDTEDEFSAGINLSELYIGLAYKF